MEKALKNFRDTFSLLDLKGLEYPTSGRENPLKSMLMILVGGEMAVYGTRYTLPNFAVVLIMYMYQNIVFLQTEILEALGGSTNETLRSIRDFFAGSTVNMLILLLIVTGVLSLAIMMMLKFFAKITIILGFVFLFSRGPGAGLLIQNGVVNNTVHLVVGILSGVLATFLFEKKINRALFASIFALAGCALIFAGVGDFGKLDLMLPYAILTLTLKEDQAGSFLEPENLVFFISILVSFVIQMKRR